MLKPLRAQECREQVDKHQSDNNDRHNNHWPPLHAVARLDERKHQPKRCEPQKKNGRHPDDEIHRVPPYKNRTYARGLGIFIERDSGLLQ
jgi:hypothetical protein